MTTSIEQAAVLIGQARKTVALTGAGVSTESGIPDFHSQNGLWSRYDPMEYGTLGAFRADPEKVWSMLRELLDIRKAHPNKGHLAMARLERMHFLAGIITQNIDMLHQKAGSRNVVEFHGSIATFSCLACGRRYAHSFIDAAGMPPRCDDCSAVLKPDIVFYDERIPDRALSQTDELLKDVEVLIVAGTSCQVFPAAHIPGKVKTAGGKIIEINREPVLGRAADVSLAGGFSSIMSSILTYCEKNK